MSTPAIELINLSYGSVLQDLSVKIEDRAITFLFGPNGAGKTTLVKLLTGELDHTSGSKVFFGRSGQELPSIGYVPQEVATYSAMPMTVCEFVSIGLYSRLGLFRFVSSSDRNLIIEALTKVGLAEQRDKLLRELSLGQLQRVALARAIVSEPAILLLDEATSGADVAARDAIHRLLGELKAKMAIVYVSHDLSVISKWADYVVCLDGRLIAHGRPEHVLTDENLRAIYGEEATYFSHCGGGHAHVHRHS